MEARTDERLFEDFRERGDTRALAALFDRTAKDLLRVAVHVTGDLADAEDLVQETFLGAIRSARRYRPEGRLRAWLVGILQNHARRRRRRRRAAPIEREPVDHAAAEGLESASAAERRAVVRDALDRLAEPYRTVLGLRFAHGFSVAEIAASLERPANTVQSQLQRGTERLRRMLPEPDALGALAAFSTAGLAAVRDRVLAAASGATAAGVAPVALRLAVAVLAVFAVGIGAPSVLRWLGASPSPVPAGVSAAVPPSAAIAETAATPSPDRVPLPAPAAAVAAYASDPVALRVVERGSRRPVPGAVVTAYGDNAAQARLDALSPEDWKAAMRLRDVDLEAFQLRFGVRHVADERGVVVVSLSESWGEMTARAGELYGERWDTDATEITVAPDRELRARVVDDSGRPVAGLGLHLGFDPGRPVTRSPNGAQRRADTGPDGIAVFRHVAAAASELRGRLGRAELCLVPFVFGVWPEPVCRVPLGVGELPGILDVRLPPAGAAEVRVVDVRGEPLGPSERWRLDVSVRSEDRKGPWSAEIGADGVARFPSLPLDRELQFTASWSGHLATAHERPRLRYDGELITIEIRFGADAPTVFGRAVDVAGRPLCGAALVARFTGPDDALAQRIDTDAGGAFRIMVPAGDPEREQTMVLGRVGLRRRGPIEMEERTLDTRATIRVPPSEPGTVHDVGAVVLAPAPRLGAGRWRVDPPRLAGKVPWLHPYVEEWSVSDGEPGWRTLAGAEVVWNDDGTFAVVGASTATRIRVRGESILGDGCTGTLQLAPLEFDSGADDLRLDVVAGADLCLDVVGPPGVLRFDLEPASGVWPVHDERALTDLAETSGVGVAVLGPARTAPLVGPLWPGRYRVSVRAFGIAEPVLVLEDVAVPAGDRVRPLRDAPLDLSARFDLLDLELVGADGASLRDATVWLRQLATGDVERVRVPNGRLRRCIPPGGWEVVATTAGAGLVAIAPPVAGPVTVPACCRVAVVFRIADRPVAEEPPPDIALRVRLEPDGSSPLRRWLDVPEIARRFESRQSNGATRLDVPAAGRYRASVVAERDGREWTAGESFVEVDADTAEVKIPVPTAGLRAR